MTFMYGVFSPRGDLVAAFADFKAADAMTAYDWKCVGDRLYWSIAPQPPTVARIEIPYIEPPADRHSITDEPIGRCSSFECSRHPYVAKASS